MSRTRAVISRLSFTLRLFLYLALIGAVGYIGFGYTSGYVAIPGDSLLRLGTGKRDVVLLRKIACDAPGTRADSPNAPPTNDPSAKPAPSQSKEMARDCEHGTLALRSLELGPPGRIGVLVDGDTSINFRRGDKGRSSITLRKGEQTSEHMLDGDTIPADVLDKVPEKLREPLKRVVAGTDDAPGGAIIEQELIAVPPAGGAPALPDPQGPGSFEFGMLHSGGTEVEYRRDTAAGEAELTIRTGDQAKTHKIAGKTVPDEILDQLPADLREPVKKMVAGIGKGGFGKGVLIDTAGAPGERAVIKRVPGGPAADDMLVFGMPGGAIAPMGAAPFERVIELPGPALVQQQVLGHTALRAALVGVTIALVLLAILQLERLLAHFQRAELFSVRNRSLMRNLGALIVLVALVQAGATLLPAILARALHPALIGALGPHLLLVFAGFSLFLLSAVMAEAGRLEEEAAHTV